MLNDVIGIVECDDCGLSIVCDPSFISIENFMEINFATTICGFCERPIISEISKDDVRAFVEVGVKVFSIEDIEDSL